LIDRNQRACLADFGLLTFANHTVSTPTASTPGTLRWMCPELLYPEEFGFDHSRPTEDSDCYALGMVILEVLSGQIPFAGDRDCVVMRKVISGERPKRPEEAWFTNDVWEMLERCWAHKPKHRQRPEVVLQRLEEASASWTTPSHSIPSSTANSPERKLPYQGKARQGTSPPREVKSRSAQGPAIHGASSGPEEQVRFFYALVFPF
jgi:hypothetical protein